MPHPLIRRLDVMLGGEPAVTVDEIDVPDPQDVALDSYDAALDIGDEESRRLEQRVAPPPPWLT